MINKAPIIPYGLRNNTCPNRRHVPGNAECVDEEAVGSNLTIAVGFIAYTHRDLKQQNITQ